MAPTAGAKRCNLANFSSHPMTKIELSKPLIAYQRHGQYFFE
jgi:hypothetical protein